MTYNFNVNHITIAFVKVAGGITKIYNASTLSMYCYFWIHGFENNNGPDDKEDGTEELYNGDNDQFFCLDYCKQSANSSHLK